MSQTEITNVDKNLNKEHHRKLFEEALNKKDIENMEPESALKKKTTSKIYNLEKINKMINIIKKIDTKPDPNLKNFIKDKEITIGLDKEKEII